MPSLSDLKRVWLLRMLGLSSSTLSEADLSSQLYNDGSFAAGVRRVNVKAPYGIGVGYFYPVSQGQVTALAGTNNVMRAYPWVLEQSCKIDQLGIDISGAGEAGSLVRLGIYGDTGDGQPGGLILDAGTVNGASATIQTVTFTALTLPPGVYWLVAGVSAAPATPPTIRMLNSQTGQSGIPIRMTVAPTGGQLAVGYSAAATGALPASFGATSLVAACPRIFIRTAV